MNFILKNICFLLLASVLCNVNIRAAQADSIGKIILLFTQNHSLVPIILSTLGKPDPIAVLDSHCAWMQEYALPCQDAGDNDRGVPNKREAYALLRIVAQTKPQQTFRLRIFKPNLISKANTVSAVLEDWRTMVVCSGSDWFSLSPQKVKTFTQEFPAVASNQIYVNISVDDLDIEKIKVDFQQERKFLKYEKE